MPKMEIDYSNTVIYKITCKDPLITELYVGHTTNFVQRKHGHKQSCINEKSNNYNCKLYKTIRANGGWDNWVMEIVAFFKCNDHYEARIKEQEYFTSLNATLNSLEPLPKPKPKPIETPQLHKEIIKKIYFCETCNITLQNQHLLDVHNQTKKHCKRVMGIGTKNIYKYVCEKCDYGTSKKSSFDKHIRTAKHLKNHSVNNMLTESCKKVATVEENTKTDILLCKNCDKEYKSRVGLWKHKKECICSLQKCEVVEKETKQHHEPTDKELIMMLIKENSDFKSMMMKVIENGTHNTSNTIKPIHITKPLT